ncbi:Glycosyltransferase, family I [Desulfonema limicola]|uniref:Glycosyltransferase, family I n=1 Tax=Desulfonema limicola TaxID=45656 RepID=A0A975GGF1_9BACT|nr:glycosyltransferase family 4 protein [Desulfonema limicola]QTA80188.1 Glycosyltransferase, family I [Desulfonema limicola]
MADENKKIAVICSNYSPYGGVEKLGLDIIKELLKQGIQVSLLTFPRQKWPLTHNKLQIIPLGISRGNRFLQAFLFNRGVNKYLSEHSFDCIFSLDRVSVFTHLHAGGGTHKSFLDIKNKNSSIMSRIFRKTSFFHLYTLYIEKKGLTANPMLKKIWCISNLVKQDICKDYPVDKDKIQVIPGGMDWKKTGETFEKRDETALKLCLKHNLSLEKNYLLFLGSGFSRKGLDTALKGIAWLPDSYELIIVGKGSQQNYSKLASNLGISKKVHFLGPQENGWKYASLCKAFVLPSRYEPFGLAAAEAQAMGLPVLISDKTGYMDCLVENKTGVILKSDADEENIKKAFNKLLNLIENPEMTPGQIRDNIKYLNNEIIMKRVIQDFMEIQPLL